MMGNITQISAVSFGSKVWSCADCCREGCSIALSGLMGSFPSQIGALSCSGRIEVIDITSSELSGTIPTGIGKLTNLRQFRIGWGSEKLSGTLPAEIRFLSKLTEIWIERTNMSGKLPRLPLGLERLLLTGNHFSGPLPDLSNMSNLTEIYLGYNKLEGHVLLPHTLEHVFMEYNYFDGPIPQFGPAIRQINLPGNQFTGSIPDFSKCAHLDVLELRNNNLSGRIPSTLGKTTQLKTLAIGNNRLSGGIPSVLSQLTKLYTLAIDQTNLVGTIPLGLSSLTKLKELFVQRNRLTGLLKIHFSSIETLWAFENNLSKIEIHPLDASKLKSLRLA